MSPQDAPVCLADPETTPTLNPGLPCAPRLTRGLLLAAGALCQTSGAPTGPGIAAELFAAANTIATTTTNHSLEETP